MPASLSCPCARRSAYNTPFRHSRSSSSLKALEWLNFFVADVQTGLGPFLAAYLLARGWSPDRVGYALTFQGLVTVGFQTPAGAIVDSARRKRPLVAVGLGILTTGAVLLFLRSNAGTVYTSGFLIGMAGPLLGPTLAAITLGLVGSGRFDTQFARNQGFNSAGNAASALLIGLIGYRFGDQAIFLTAAFFAIPSLISLTKIDPAKIDDARARGSVHWRFSYCAGRCRRPRVIVEGCSAKRLAFRAAKFACGRTTTRLNPVVN